MKLKIEITMDNAAFEQDAGEEAARILNRLSEQLQEWPGGNTFEIGLLDIFGNKVGEAKVTR